MKSDKQSFLLYTILYETRNWIYYTILYETRKKRAVTITLGVNIFMYCTNWQQLVFVCNSFYVYKSVLKEKKSLQTRTRLIHLCPMFFFLFFNVRIYSVEKEP